MRILHTADWHVGRTLRGRGRDDEHRAVLAELVEVARRERVDVVLVAGDLFDSAAPTPSAEQIVYRALLDLADTGAEVVLVAGNHDNPQRLAAIKPLLERGSGLHGAAELARPEAGGVLTLATRGGERARLALLPFVSQRRIVRADDLMTLAPDEQADKYADRLLRMIELLCAGAGADTVNLLVAHLMVFGATATGSERAVHLASDYALPAAAFPAAGLHYVALGHVHRAQQLPAACPVWYCGSPLQLDFGETEDEKCVLLVEATAGTPAEVRRLPLAAGRRLRKLRGTLAELAALAAGLGDELLRVEVAEAPRPGLADEVRDLFPNAVDVRLAPGERAAPDAAAEGARHEATPRELFARYLAERGREDPDLLALFTELLEEAHAPPAS